MNEPTEPESRRKVVSNSLMWRLLCNEHREQNTVGTVCRNCKGGEIIQKFIHSVKSRERSKIILFPIDTIK